MVNIINMKLSRLVALAMIRATLVVMMPTSLTTSVVVESKIGKLQFSDGTPLLETAERLHVKLGQPTVYRWPFDQANRLAPN
jgi:hypothetical protein